MWKLFDNFYVRRVASFILAFIDFRYWCGKWYNSKELDVILWDTLKGCGDSVDAVCLYYGTVGVWYANYPYSCGNTRIGLDYSQEYPTIITRYKLKSVARAMQQKQMLEALNHIGQRK